MKSTILAGLLSASLLTCSAITLAGAGKAHWGYGGHEGPSHWGELTHDYHMCKDGKKQSPINISAASKAKLDNIKFSYKASAKEILNNGHTIQINMNKGSKITVNGKDYNLLQFHFHSPSEHTVDGKPADMVAHFVHQAADGQLGVIGVLMKKGKANTALAKLWSNMPSKKGDKKSLKGKIDISKLMPGSKAYYNYSGSLTTPPCSEGVNWMVLQSTAEVSAEQVAAFTRIFDSSVRPVQPLNGRTISLSK